MNIKRKRLINLAITALTMAFISLVLPNLISSNKAFLMRAVEKGDLAQVRAATKNQDINRQGREGMTALMMAASLGHQGIAQFLLEQKASPNMTSEFGWTALMFAAHEGYAPMVKLLLQYGASPSVVSEPIVHKGSTRSSRYPKTTALAEALKKDITTAKLLIDSGAELDAYAVSASVQLEQIDMLEDFWQKDADFSNAFCAAIAEGDIKFEMLEWLMQKKVNPNGVCSALCKGVRSSLSDIYYSNTEDHEQALDMALEVSKKLVEYGADINATCDDLGVVSPLSASLLERNLPLTHYLLEQGADPNKVLYQDSTALFDVYGVPSAALLLKYNTSIDHKNENGHTAAYVRTGVDFKKSETRITK